MTDRYYTQSNNKSYVLKWKFLYEKDIIKQHDISTFGERHVLYKLNNNDIQCRERLFANLYEINQISIRQKAKMWTSNFQRRKKWIENTKNIV